MVILGQAPKTGGHSRYELMGCFSWYLVDLNTGKKLRYGQMVLHPLRTAM